jgi:DNA-binding MarR family transcriptional regulator
VSTYELIAKLSQLDYFKDLLKQGIIPLNWTNYKQIYEFYQEEKQHTKGKQLITNVCEKFKISESSVYAIVKKMEE